MSRWILSVACRKNKFHICLIVCCFNDSITNCFVFRYNHFDQHAPLVNGRSSLLEMVKD